MLLDNLTLAYLVKELKPILKGAYVNKVSELKNAHQKIKLHTKQGSKDLILTPNELFLTNYSLQARHTKSSFAVALKKELYNKKIVDLQQHEFDRVITINFLEHSLILELLGQGNKILVDSKGKIIACQKNERWADRTTKKGEQYVFPKPRGINPLKLTQQNLKKAFEESKKDVIRSLVGFVNVSPIVAEEILFRAKRKKD